jgi:hypothetical protein
MVLGAGTGGITLNACSSEVRLSEVVYALGSPGQLIINTLETCMRVLGAPHMGLA